MRRWAFLACLLSTACGGGGGNSAAGPTPSAIVTVAASGPVVFHPSAQPQFESVIEVPLRVAEINGGSADWNFARLQRFRGNVQVGQVELGAQEIAALGYARVEPLSASVRTLVFRLPPSDATSFNVFLGFSDRNNGAALQMYVTNFEPSQFDPRPLFTGAAGAR